MRLPKIELNRRNRILIATLIIALSIPVTLALIRVSQELRRRAAPPVTKTYRFTSDMEADGALEKRANGPFASCSEGYSTASAKTPSDSSIIGSEEEVGATCGGAMGPYWIKRLFLSFDTSSIPEDEEVVSAQICVTVKDNLSALGQGPITVDVYQYSWQTPGTLSPADWDERSADDFEAHLVENLSEFPVVTNATYWQPVNPSKINKKGRTEYRLNSADEELDREGTRFLTFYTGDSPSFPPCLEVTTTTPPPPTASIVGTKFEDLNGNQTQDSEEPGMAGVTILLKDSSGTEISRTTTNSEGHYEFLELELGTYIVEEAVPEGFEATTPTAVTVSDLAAGEQREVDFGNRAIPPPEKGKIFGYKWNDQNGNGVWDTGEPVYTDGVIITLGGPSGEQTWPTDEGGYFEFSNLDPGSYTISETVPESWQATTPTSVGVTLAAGAEEQVNFGNVYVPPAKGRIYGHKFLDANEDGVFDAGEAGMGGVTITLKDAGGGVITSMQTREGTDAGFYSFEDLEPGNYVVEETTPEGFAATTTVSVPVENLKGGENRQVNFGNKEVVGGPQDPVCTSLTADQTSGTIPLTVNFTVTAYDPDGSIVSYEYDFGDGSDKEVLSSSTTSHTYQTAGTYLVAVRVQDNDGAWATSDGCQVTITASSPETPTHRVCQDSSCVTVEGEGVNECTTDPDCTAEPTPTPTPTPTPVPTPPPSGLPAGEPPVSEGVPPEVPEEAPVPPTAVTTPTLTFIFTSLALIALGILVIL